MYSIASLESAMLSNTEKAILLRELAGEFGYRLYSKTPTYILIDRGGDYPVTEAEWFAHKGAAVKAISYSWKPLEDDGYFTQGTDPPFRPYSLPSSLFQTAFAGCLPRPTSVAGHPVTWLFGFDGHPVLRSAAKQLGLV
jgi:hypothetical protein